VAFSEQFQRTIVWMMFFMAQIIIPILAQKGPVWFLLCREKDSEDQYTGSELYRYDSYQEKKLLLI